MFKKIFGTLAVIALPLIGHAAEYRTVEYPRQECWNEQVPVQSAASGYGGAVMGGIAGGILGNQVGRGNGRTVATAVGAATGALVGDRMSSDAISYKTVQRCRTVIDYQQVPVVREPVQIIREPVRIIREPVPVVERVYYIEPDEYDHHHTHWKHHRHERDDSDDD